MFVRSALSFTEPGRVAGCEHVQTVHLLLQPLRALFMMLAVSCFRVFPVVHKTHADAFSQYTWLLEHLLLKLAFIDEAVADLLHTAAKGIHVCCHGIWNLWNFDKYTFQIFPVNSDFLSFVDLVVMAIHLHPEAPMREVLGDRMRALRSAV